MKWKLTLLLSLSPWTTLLHGAPSVSGVTGTFSQGNTLTVSGSNFTTVSSVTAQFEDFETGLRLPYWNIGGITSMLGVIADATNARDSFSVYLSSVNMATNSGSGGACLQGSNSLTSGKWYVSYWVKLGNDWNWGAGAGGDDGSQVDDFLANIKMFRLWNPGSRVENVFWPFDGTQSNGQFEYVPESLSGQTINYMKTNVSTPSSNFPLGVWHKLTWEAQDSSAQGVADAAYKFWIDGVLVYSNSGLKWSINEPAGDKRPQVIGFQNEWGGAAGTQQAPNSFYIDDMVVRGGTLSRVLITTNSTINVGGVEEEQNILTWSATSITLQSKVNMLENSSSATKYIYICDDTGLCSAGFSLGTTYATTLNPIATPRSVITSSVAFNWTPAGTSYSAVFSSVSTLTPIITSGAVTTSATSYANLQSRTTYYFKVSLSTESNYSSVISTETLWTQLSPSITSIATGSFTANWTAGGSNYNAILFTDSGYTTVFSSGLATTNTTSYFTLGCNTPYYFQVQTATEAYTDHIGNQASATTSACPVGGNPIVNIQGTTLKGVTIR